MKIKILLGIFTIIILSCDQHEIEKPDIKIEFLDDVSPVLVKFSVEDKWYKYEWQFNDLYYPSSPNVTNETYYLFNPNDTAKVILEVSTWDNSTTVEKDFITPPLPSKLRIEGIVFNRNIINSDSPENFQINFRLYDGVENKYDSTFIKISNSKNDTFYFDYPIEYDVSKLLLNQEADLKTYVWVNSKNENAIISGYFRNYYNEFFLIRNRYDPLGLQLINNKSFDSTSLFLIVDWTN